MDFISVSRFAERHGISERTVRNYCATGKVCRATAAVLAMSSRGFGTVSHHGGFALFLLSRHPELGKDQWLSEGHLSNGTG